METKTEAEEENLNKNNQDVENCATVKEEQNIDVNKEIMETSLNKIELNTNNIINPTENNEELMETKIEPIIDSEDKEKEVKPEIMETSLNKTELDTNDILNITENNEALMETKIEPIIDSEDKEKEVKEEPQEIATEHVKEPQTNQEIATEHEPQTNQEIANEHVKEPQTNLEKANEHVKEPQTNLEKANEHVKEPQTNQETATEHINGRIDNTISCKTNQDNVKTAVKSSEAAESTTLVNPLKRKRSRPPKNKRKPKFNRVMVNEIVPAAVEPETDIDTSVEVKEEVEYCLTVSNLPNSWSFMEIKNYIDTECGPVDEIEMIKDDETRIGAIRLSYQTEEECKIAVQKLKDKEVGGKKLVLEVTVESLESDSETKSETTEATKKPWKPDLDFWEVDIQGMYGLKLQYLRSLGITPPLDKWVHVSNFRCDKSELRDVMEMAGNVQMCSMFSTTPRYANVMYSHPLEAVQAVSMLNNQLFYGQLLKVAMDRSPIDTILLPKGLSNIGKGLGLNGKPLKNIVKHYERFVENKDCLINPTMFDIPENHSLKLNDVFESVKFQVKSVEEFNYPMPDKTKSVAVKKATVAATTPVPAQTPIPAKTPPKPANIVTPPRETVPVRANFTPQQNFPQRQFAPNFRPFPGPQAAMNAWGDGGMQGPQGPSGPMGPMQPGPPRPQHPFLPGPQRPPGQFMRPFGPMNPAPGMNPVPPGPMNPGPGPMNPGPGPMNLGPGPMNPGPGPMNPGPGPMNPGPGPMQYSWGQGPMRPPGPMFPNEPVKLILSNLPPSTTFALLCEKMSEWGHVVCIQLTTPGCAVVTFGNRMQADACFQHYNGRNIENHFIQIKYA